MKTLTILIPAYNEEKTIIKCIDSLLSQREMPRIALKILVITNNCSDRTYELVEKYIQNKKLKNIFLYNNDERGKPKALNFGMKKVVTDFFAVIDADCTLDTDCIEKVIEEFEKNNKLQIVGALDRPVFKETKSLLYEYQKAQQVYREERGRVLPVGRFYMFKSDVIKEFPVYIHSEDTWLDLFIASKYGWESVKVCMDAVVYFTPAQNWIDYIKQESRFECGLPQILEYFPLLEKTWEDRRKGRKEVVSRDEIFKNIRERLKRDGIKESRIDEFDTIIEDIIEDNANIMRYDLISKEGFWDPIISTKE